MEYLDKKTMEKKLRKENAGLSYKELRKLWPAYRKKEIEKEIKKSGYLSFSELLSFLKEKGVTIDPETKNLVRFATNNDLKIKRFGRVGKAGYDSAYFQKPSPEKIKEIIKMLRNNNNTLPGRKALKEKKREIIKVFNESGKKEETKTSIAEIVSDNTGLITNRKLVRAVLEKEKTKTELEAKLKKIG
jgi:hypothetical protein